MPPAVVNEDVRHSVRNVGIRRDWIRYSRSAEQRNQMNSSPHYIYERRGLVGAVLWRNHDAVVQSLDLTYVREKLIASGVINWEELESLEFKATRADKARGLLKLVARKGLQALKGLISSLKEDYDWLTVKLEKSIRVSFCLGDCQCI